MKVLLLAEPPRNPGPLRAPALTADRSLRWCASIRGVRCACQLCVWGTATAFGQRNRPDVRRPIGGLSSGRYAIQLRGWGSSSGVAYSSVVLSLAYRFRFAVYCCRRGPRKRDVGGAEETRTPDPLLAKEVLSQLSYGPALGCWSLEVGCWTLNSSPPTSYDYRPNWWGILDSNQRPQSYQDCALTS